MVQLGLLGQVSTMLWWRAAFQIMTKGAQSVEAHPETLVSKAPLRADQKSTAGKAEAGHARKASPRAGHR